MGYEFLGEKILTLSAPVLGINNDQSLNLILTAPILECNRFFLAKSIGLLYLNP